MLYMTWDEALAVTARAWARHCVFEHNIFLIDVQRVHPSFPSVGENLWAGSPTFNVRRVINDSWVKEKLAYNYEENICSDYCGHYTQVVWASSYKVGCAAQLCPHGVKKTKFATRQGIIFVCNYAPAGNVNGRQPYESQGQACSGCEGACKENLCQSPERDSQKRYNWTTDWDPALMSTGSTHQATSSGYVAVLIVRPIAVICTFMAAYTVHRFYPNVFCYE
ncbi:GLIPR1-like protein 1 [Aulostomus maculatus]